MFKSSLIFRNLLSSNGFEIVICNKSPEAGISQQKFQTDSVENYFHGIYFSVCTSFQPGMGDPAEPVAT